MIFLDKQGEAFEVKKGSLEDTPRLVEMYETFQPKGRFQGLPPLNSLPCGAWIRHLFKTGENHLALRDHRMIGHAVLLPDMALLDGEYLVFVHQQHRGLSVGSQLTRCALDQARSLGLTIIWLTVDASNFIAIRLYKKFGFKFCDDACLDGERKMELPLERSTGSC